MIRVGLIGCGYWGRNYARVISELNEAEFAGACDSDPARLDDIRRKYPQTSVYETPEALLLSQGIDAVVISTPANSHYSLGKLALSRKKSTLMEKPLCLNTAEAEDLCELAEKNNTLLMVGHTFLYNPAVRMMKDIISRDDFGRIYYMQAIRTHLGLVRQDVNALWDLAPHDISIFNYLVGETPKWVSGVGSCFLHPNREDVSFATLHYSGGILGNVHVSWIDSNKVRSISVVGNNKRIFFDDLNPLERIRVFEKGVSVTGEVDSFGEFQLSLRDGDIVSPKLETSEPLKNQCKHFVSCIANNEKPLTGGVNGLNVIRTLKAIEKSLAQQGQPVEV